MRCRTFPAGSQQHRRGTSMEALIACASLIALGAITPGPNNFAVLRIAVAQGVRPAIPAMAGIVLGGLAMLALGQLGLAAFIDSYPWLRRAIAVVGGAYLVWLGVALVVRSFRPCVASAGPERGAPDGLVALFVFQFTNPKSWTLVLTVSAAASGVASFASTAMLFALFLAIPSAALAAWAFGGRLIAPLLRNSVARARFDRAMGVLLAASALALLTQQ